MAEKNKCSFGAWCWLQHRLDVHAVLREYMFQSLLTAQVECLFGGHLKNMCVSPR